MDVSGVDQAVVQPSAATRPRVDVGGVTRTYAELDDVTDRMAAGFAALGLETGEHVSLMMQNSVENVDAWFGLQKAGSSRSPFTPPPAGRLFATSSTTQTPARS